MSLNVEHMYWFLGGAIISFLVPALFGNNKNISIDLYYLIYFVVIVGFLTLYVKNNGIDIKSLIKNNLLITFVVTLLFSLIMIKSVLSYPATEKLAGNYLTWSIFWRGLIYGLVDGALLSVFPFLVVWNTFNVMDKTTPQKILFGLLTYVFVIIITNAYHLGYKDFRSKKVIGANIGNSIISTPTIITANPISSPITHATMHITSVLHSPETEYFLPPHR
jgi:hypothetical protein